MRDSLLQMSKQKKTLLLFRAFKWIAPSRIVAHSKVRRESARTRVSGSKHSYLAVSYAFARRHLLSLVATLRLRKGFSSALSQQSINLCLLDHLHRPWIVSPHVMLSARCCLWATFDSLRRSLCFVECGTRVTSHCDETFSVTANERTARLLC